MNAFLLPAIHRFRVDALLRTCAKRESSFGSCPWVDRIVPVAVKRGALNPQPSHFLVGDFLAGGIPIGVKRGADTQPLGRAGVSDEIDDDFMADQRSAPPVEGDVRKHAMLDF